MGSTSLAGGLYRIPAMTIYGMIERIDDGQKSKQQKKIITSIFLDVRSDSSRYLELLL